MKPIKRMLDPNMILSQGKFNLSLVRIITINIDFNLIFCTLNKTGIIS
jgi:hypothetical protein